MKSTHISNSIKAAVLVTALSCGASLHAVTIPTPVPVNGIEAGQSQFEAVAFSNSAEADMLRRAYRILATGDHDYDGHRVKAMRQVEAAGTRLGIDLKGDLKDHEKQVISNDKLREARDLLNNVLGAAEVKKQPRIAKHLTEAINQIDIALSVR